MNDQISEHAFLLEERFPGIFLAQAAVGGAIAGLLLSFTTILLAPSLDHLGYILYTPTLILMCIAYCVCLSVPLWFCAYFLELPMPAPIRILTATVVSICFWHLFGYFPIDEPQIDTRLWFFSAGVLTGVVTGALVGSSIRPWGFLTSGTIKVKEQDRWTRKTVPSIPAVIAILPLRLLSAAFLIFVLLIIFSLRENWSRRLDSIIISVFPTIYWMAAVYLSYRSPRASFLISLSILLNLPVAWVASVCFSAPTTGFFGSLPLVIAIFCTFFMSLWAVCVAARVWASRNREHKPIVLVGHSQPGHRCLGSIFLEWEANAAHYQRR